MAKSKKAAYAKQRKDAVAGSYDSRATSQNRRHSYDTAIKIYRKLPTNKNPNTDPFDRDMLDAFHASDIADYKRSENRSKSRSKKKTTKRTPKRKATRKASRR